MTMLNTLIIDNYDSFTYNLYQYVAELGGNPIVKRNDEIGIADVRAMNTTHIIVGPGPGSPLVKRDTGISNELLKFAEEKHIPFLGVCLGHQILGAVFGATIVRAPEPRHGKVSTVHIEGKSVLFRGLGSAIEAMRYHSLCVARETIPTTLRVTGVSEDGVVMAMEHATLPLYGVQFHPESIGTPSGKRILKNFLSLHA